MSSAGMSGMGDITSESAAARAAPDPGGQPEDVVEVVEVEGLGNLPGVLEEEGMPGPTMRWWLVPAVALPVIVGGGAGVWYLVKGKQSFIDAYELVMGRRRPPAARARALWRRSTTRLRRTSRRGVPDQLEDVREKMAEAIGAIDAAALADRASDLWDGALDQVEDLWETLARRRGATRAHQRAQTANRAASRWFRLQVGTLTLAGMRFAARRRIAELRNRAQRQAQAGKQRAATSVTAAATRGGPMGWLPGRRATALKATTRGTAIVAATSARATKTARKSRRRARSYWRRTQAFGLGVLISALVTYIRTWQARINERTTRETAGGRMVREA
jgi:hypothetical protein